MRAFQQNNWLPGTRDHPKKIKSAEKDYWSNEVPTISHNRFEVALISGSVQCLWTVYTKYFRVTSCLNKTLKKKEPLQFELDDGAINAVHDLIENLLHCLCWYDLFSMSNVPFIWICPIPRLDICCYKSRKTMYWSLPTTSYDRFVRQKQNMIPHTRNF